VAYSLVNFGHRILYFT